MTDLSDAELTMLEEHCDPTFLFTSSSAEDCMDSEAIEVEADARFVPLSLSAIDQCEPASLCVPPAAGAQSSSTAMSANSSIPFPTSSSICTFVSSTTTANSADLTSESSSALSFPSLLSSSEASGVVIPLLTAGLDGQQHRGPRGGGIPRSEAGGSLTRGPGGNSRSRVNALPRASDRDRERDPNRPRTEGKLFGKIIAPVVQLNLRSSSQIVDPKPGFIFFSVVCGCLAPHLCTH